MLGRPNAPTRNPKEASTVDLHSRSDARRQDAAARAIERVLGAERDAAGRIEQGRCEAQAMLDAARDEGLAIVNRAAQRISRWQQAHGQALAARLAALRAQAAASADAAPAPDESSIGATTARLAARLTASDAEASER
jgi:vacuolar-type H+-ATPase subunit H